MKVNLFSAGLLIVMLASLLANIWQHNELEKLRLKPASRESDAPFVQKASAYWIRKSTAEGARSDMDNRYARVMYFGGRVCVSLQLMDGVGGIPVYCFDEKSGQLIEKYDEVE